MGDFEAQLQRAIMNSLRDTGGGRSSVRAGPSGFTQSRTTYSHSGTNRPTPQPVRSSHETRPVPYYPQGNAPRHVPPPPRSNRTTDIAPTIPGLRGGPARRNQLQREGILPTQPSTRISQPQRDSVSNEGIEESPAKEPSKAKPPAQAQRSTSRSTSNHNPKKESSTGPPGPPTSLADGLDPRFVEVIESEILERSPGVQWDDIAGAPDAKRLLNEAIVLPLLVPDFFQGIRQPWRGVLLFGPPGTGKTMLARAIATCTKTTFFNISPSVLVSRYHGESEKLVRTLFRVARKHAPATVFLDEVDALIGKRGEGQEHEASRRLKSELLSQLDGIEAGAASGVIVVATTNRPWDLDEAMRRRLEKRIYLALPDAESREQLFRLHLKGVTLEPDVDPTALAALTEGYSGADINQVCREAAMAPMRRAVAGRSPQEISDMKDHGKLTSTALPVSHMDVVGAVKNVPPSVSSAEIGRYGQWMQEFGSK